MFEILGKYKLFKTDGQFWGEIYVELLCFEKFSYKIARHTRV